MLKRITLVALVCAVGGFAQSSSVSSAQLVIDVRPEATLTWQGVSTVLGKARLAPGTQARVWADESCGAPTAMSQVISASGTVVIQLADINGTGKPVICLSSSDGRLSLNLAALRN
jgi:hypothetical protein